MTVTDVAEVDDLTGTSWLPKATTDTFAGRLAPEMVTEDPPAVDPLLGYTRGAAIDGALEPLLRGVTKTSVLRGPSPPGPTADTERRYSRPLVRPEIVTSVPVVMRVNDPSTHTR